MHWVIICADGLPLAEFESGRVVLLPTVREASKWMMPSDLRVERYDPAVHVKRPGAQRGGRGASA